jgi:phenylalanyl-tRNA synthetase beta chain
MGKALAASFGSNDNALTLNNPISSDWDQMRPSILPNLISAAATNADKGNGDTKLFEVGPVFPSAKPSGQQTHACGVRYGTLAGKHWSSSEAHRKNDIYDVKADAFAALEAAGVPTANLQTDRSASAHYHPGRSATLRLGKNILAQFGEIHPAILDDMDIKSTVVGFEVFLNQIPEAKKKGSSRPLLQLSPFQPLSRDFAFIVDENVEVEQIIRAAHGAERNLVSGVSVFDIYQGKGVEDGKKSVAINVGIQPVKQTLTDAEIEGLSKKIVDAVSAKTGATLRG